MPSNAGKCCQSYPITPPFTITRLCNCSTMSCPTRSPYITTITRCCLPAPGWWRTSLPPPWICHSTTTTSGLPAPFKSQSRVPDPAPPPISPEDGEHPAGGVPGRHHVPHVPHSEATSQISETEHQSLTESRRANQLCTASPPNPLCTPRASTAVQLQTSSPSTSSTTMGGRTPISVHNCSKSNWNVVSTNKIGETENSKIYKSRMSKISDFFNSSEISNKNIETKAPRTTSQSKSQQVTNNTAQTTTIGPTTNNKFATSKQARDPNRKQDLKKET